MERNRRVRWRQQERRLAPRNLLVKGAHLGGLELVIKGAQSDLFPLYLYICPPPPRSLVPGDASAITPRSRQDRDCSEVYEVVNLPNFQGRKTYSQHISSKSARDDKTSSLCRTHIPVTACLPVFSPLRGGRSLVLRNLLSFRTPDSGGKRVYHSTLHKSLRGE